MSTCNRWNLNFLASLCSWGDWFETRFVGHPEDRFSRDEAHMETQKQTDFNVMAATVVSTKSDIDVI